MPPRMATPARPCYAPAMLVLSPEILERLRAYAALLQTWTRHINLISQSDAANPAHLWARHIEDSLRLIPHIPPNTPRIIDLGSGAGLPGLVLAIATGIPADLIESDTRKAAFLREAIRLTQAPAQVHHTRIESADLPPAPLVTARALAPLPRLLHLATPHLAPGGTLLLHKGAQAQTEIEAARATWSFTVQAHGPATSPILAITNPALLIHD